MVRRTIAMATLMIAFPGAASAQMPKGAGPDPKAMYEDIEILRRILIKELGTRSNRYEIVSYPVATDESVRRGIDWLRKHQYGYGSYAVDSYASLAFTPDGTQLWAAKQATPATIEGAYLKGHGVTYALSVSGSDRVYYDPSSKATGLMSICIKCHLAETVERFLNPGIPNRSPPKVSDWEKVRREVKGEKAEPQPSVASTFQMQSICAPGNLTEQIIRVLAENGHNFQQLPDGEYISVVVTLGVPRVEPTDAPRKSPNRPAALRNADRSIEAADVCLKAQKYEEAMTHYTDAIKFLQEEPIAFPANLKYETARQFLDEAQLMLRSSHTKLAQACLAAGKTAEAKAALTRAETATVKVNLPKENPEAKVSPNLPAKVLITVSKKSLDQHHDGKLSLEQFRKEVEVQSINLPPAEKKSNP